MEDVDSCNEEIEMSRGALIGIPTEPNDPAEAAGCSSGKEVVVYSKLPPHNSCRAVVPVENDSASQTLVVDLSWDADWAWTSRMYNLLVDAVRLKVMLAWSSTLGGAYSALGDSFTSHAKVAGNISRCQLVLAGRMGDSHLASRCKLYEAYSLMQRNKLHRAAAIIRDQYHFISKESPISDAQLEAMCLSIWRRLQHLHRIKYLKQLPPSSGSEISSIQIPPPVEFPPPSHQVFFHPASASQLILTIFVCFWSLGLFSSQL